MWWNNHASDSPPLYLSLQQQRQQQQKEHHGLLLRETTLLIVQLLTSRTTTTTTTTTLQLKTKKIQSQQLWNLKTTMTTQKKHTTRIHNLLKLVWKTLLEASPPWQFPTSLPVPRKHSVWIFNCHTFSTTMSRMDVTTVQLTSW